MTNPFKHEPRKQFTAQHRARLFAAANGSCAACKRKLGPRDWWQIDHVLALELGGTNDDANLQVICDWCHKPKTAGDHADAGHARRIYTKHNVPKEFQRAKGWWK